MDNRGPFIRLRNLVAAIAIFIAGILSGRCDCPGPEPVPPVQPPVVTPVEPQLPVPTTDLDQVIYVYQRDQGTAPTGVLAALSRLNEDGKVIAVPFEVDQTDGDGNVPALYAHARQAGIDAGVPCLVIIKGDKTRTAIVNDYNDVMREVGGTQ